MQKEKTLGVVVGRFQVPNLHSEHKMVIQHALDRNDEVLVILGVSPLMNTRKDPLDVSARKQMIAEEFPTVRLAYLNDVSEDKLWTQRLESLVGKEAAKLKAKATLYGSRDSFLAPYYEAGGILPGEEIEAKVKISGTTIREKIGSDPVKGTQEWREAMVKAAFMRFPTVFTTADVVPRRTWYRDGIPVRQLLVGKKPNETAPRFIGGFADPELDSSVKGTAIREAKEESGITFDRDDLTYVDSIEVDDWRYQGTGDKIITHLFYGPAHEAEPEAGDDLESVQWIDEDYLFENYKHFMTKTHWPLVEALAEAIR